MLRLAELALFLSPFAAFALWRLTASRGGPSPLVLLVSAGAVAVLLVLLIRFSRHDALGRNQAYVPARIEDGRIVQGHAGTP